MNLNLQDDSTPETASTWLRQLVREFGGGFHLDTRPEEYTRDDGEQVFTGPECDILEASIERLFSILGDELPYEIGTDEAYAILGESRGMRPPFENYDPEHQQRLIREGTRTELIDWLFLLRHCLTEDCHTVARFPVQQQLSRRNFLHGGASSGLEIDSRI